MYVKSIFTKKTNTVMIKNEYNEIISTNDMIIKELKNK